MVAKSACTLVSGGARGIDEASMQGASGAGGAVVGVLADSLERAVLSREYRSYLMDGRLALVSPYDPAAGFNVGHAMRRNKLIYALADAALIVNSDYEQGGTWAGAVEQLESLQFVPLYVRSSGQIGIGLEALRRKGAQLWPNPSTPEDLVRALRACSNNKPNQEELCLESNPVHVYETKPHVEASASNALDPSDKLFSTVRSLLADMKRPKTEVEVAIELKVSSSQAKTWLERLVNEGVLKKFSNPTRYCAASMANPYEARF